MLDQLTSFLISAGVPRPPGTNPNLVEQAQELLESPGRLRAAWAEVRGRLEEEGYEAGEFARFCRVHLNLLDNCAVLLELLGRLSSQLSLSSEKLCGAQAEVKSQQEEIRPLFELATRKPPPLDLQKLLAAHGKHAGEPAVEVSEFLRRVQAGEVAL